MQPGDLRGDEVVTGSVDPARATEVAIEVAVGDEPASAAWVRWGGWVSVSVRAAHKASTSGSGTTAKPSRSEGDSVFENVAT